MSVKRLSPRIVEDTDPPFAPVAVMKYDDDGLYVPVSNYAALLARVARLEEALAWERELDEVLVWLVQTGRYPKDMGGKYDLAAERDCARSEVDRLLGEAEG